MQNVYEMFRLGLRPKCNAIEIHCLALNLEGGGMNSRKSLRRGGELRFLSKIQNEAQEHRKGGESSKMG